MKINILTIEEKAFIKYCHSILDSCDTIEEVLMKMDHSRRNNK